MRATAFFSLIVAATAAVHPNVEYYPGNYEEKSTEAGWSVCQNTLCKRKTVNGVPQTQIFSNLFPQRMVVLHTSNTMVQRNEDYRQAAKLNDNKLFGE